MESHWVQSFQIRTTLVSSIAVPTFPPDTWQDTWRSKGGVLRPGKETSHKAQRCPSPWGYGKIPVMLSAAELLVKDFSTCWAASSHATDSVIPALVSYHVWQGGFWWCSCLWASPASLSCHSKLIGLPTRLRWHHYFDWLSVPSSILSEWHPGNQGHSDPINILSLAEWAADLQLSRSCHFPHTHLSLELDFCQWPRHKVGKDTAEHRSPRLMTARHYLFFSLQRPYPLTSALQPWWLPWCPWKTFLSPLPPSLTINLFFNWIPFSSVPPAVCFQLSHYSS